MSTATDAELDDFWGVADRKSKWDAAQRRHAAAYDKDDLTVVCWEREADILDAINKGDHWRLGEIFKAERENTITRRCEIEIHGCILDRQTEKPA
jgi:hypothetical protein